MNLKTLDSRKLLSKYSIILVLIVIMIACTFINSSFLTANNLILNYSRLCRESG